MLFHILAQTECTSVLAKCLLLLSSTFLRHSGCSEFSKEETSSGADEYQPPHNEYLLARQELQDMELFYTQEQNLPRKGVAGSYETSAPVAYLLDHLQALLKETRCVRSAFLANPLSISLTTCKHS